MHEMYRRVLRGRPLGPAGFRAMAETSTWSLQRRREACGARQDRRGAIGLAAMRAEGPPRRDRTPRSSRGAQPPWRSAGGRWPPARPAPRRPGADLVHLVAAREPGQEQALSGIREDLALDIREHIGFEDLETNGNCGTGDRSCGPIFPNSAQAKPCLVTLSEPAGGRHSRAAILARSADVAQLARALHS